MNKSREIKKLMKKDKMSYETALEYYRYNIERALPYKKILKERKK